MLIPFCFSLLTGFGAHKFAVESGLEALSVPPEALLTDRTQHEWGIWMRRLERESQCSNPSSTTPVHGADRKAHHNDDDDRAPPFQDTVGAISCDSEGSMAAGVSRYARLEIVQR